MSSMQMLSLPLLQDSLEFYFKLMPHLVLLTGRFLLCGWGEASVLSEHCIDSHGYSRSL